MALLVMIVRRMVSNKWLTLSLVCGLVLANALVCSVPIYTNAILQRMLVQDLQNTQIQTGTYPGLYYAKVYVGPTSYWDEGDYEPEDRPRVIRRMDEFLRREAAPRFGVPVREFVRETATELYTIVPDDPSLVDASTKRRLRFAARKDLADHVRLVDGRWPAQEPVDGVFEVLVVEQTLREFNMVLGNVFRIEDEWTDAAFKIMPVGVIDKLDNADPYWNQRMDEYRNTFFLDEALFEQAFMNALIVPPSVVSWNIVLDYTEMDLVAVPAFLETVQRIEEFLAVRSNHYETAAPAAATVESYLHRESSLDNLLWTLNVPVLLMLAYYLYMVSNLTVEQRSTEIAVLRSRGAGRMQIVFSYAVEGALLGAVALATGPAVGALLTKVLGASNGFLTFVDRSALRVTIVPDAYRYAAVAALATLAMTLIPVMRATRVSVVDRKRLGARRPDTSDRQKVYLDFLLLAVAGYGLYAFGRQRSDWMRFGIDPAETSVDPLLFLVPALFVLGLGMFALRLYPFAVRILYRLGRTRWPAPLYAVLLQVGRSGSQYRFVMVFLIMTIAMGLYSAGAARTLNRNTEDLIRYKNGTDIVLQQLWTGSVRAVLGGGSGSGGGQVRYIEPPFQPFVDLPGVEQATKVFVKEGVQYRSGPRNGTVTLMGIHTAQFGRTAWMREDLLDYPMAAYLNLFARDPQAVLVSRSLADQGVRPGDTITLGWEGTNTRTFTVYGVVDYWPSFRTHPLPGEEEAPALVVGHLAYIQMALGLEPYQVWLKLAEGADRRLIYDRLAEAGVLLVSLKDTQEEVRRAMNDPFQLAINGAMTLGFLITTAICLFGFLLYWMLTLSGRTVQYGVFRAMGISFRQLVAMLTVEQLLTSGAAMVIGGAVGGLTGALFIRLFQLSLDPAEQILPFRAAFERLDAIRLFAVVAGMIGCGLLLISMRMRRMRIGQALKLGED